MKKLILASITAFLLIAGCSSEQSGNQGTADNEQKTENPGGLTDFQMKNGIGPLVEPISLDEVDKERAQKGAQIFETKCSACHKLNERYVGPALGDILDKRTPTYVMNMILNPDQMIKEHPEAKKQLAEFMTPMPNQNLTRTEARSIVEYLASVPTDTSTSQVGK